MSVRIEKGSITTSSNVEEAHDRRVKEARQKEYEQNMRFKNRGSTKLHIKIQDSGYPWGGGGG